jgi:hypothetical protein
MDKSRTNKLTYQSIKAPPSMTLRICLLILLIGCSGEEAGKAIVNIQGSEDTNRIVETKEVLPDTYRTNRIELINFHSTHRCKTCKAIEVYSKYVLTTFYVAETKSGRIIFKEINVDELQNAEIAALFQATGTALFLNVVEEGKQKHIDITNQALSTVKEKNIFVEMLKSQISPILKGI